MINFAVPASFKVIALEDVGSTNDEARRLALSGAAADLVVVTAQRQSQGRGRRGREWISPVGNLFFSLLIKLDGNLAEAAQLGFAAAAAQVQAFQELGLGADFAAKWPNDVLVGMDKCSGMLLEPVDRDWLILGIGVNVVAAPPKGSTPYPATCLADLGYAGDKDQILAAILTNLLPLIQGWRTRGFGPIRDAWLAVARGVGGEIVVRLDRETLTGQFAGLDVDGALVLDQRQLGIRRILAGDVYFPS